MVFLFLHGTLQSRCIASDFLIEEESEFYGHDLD